MASGSIFTDDEQDILDRTKKVRIDLVDNMVKGGVPEKVGDIRVLNEVLSGLDKMVQDSAANRLKHQENLNNEATKDMVSDVIKSIAVERAKNATVSVVKPVLEIEYVPDDAEVVEGELEISPDSLNPDDFVK